MDYDRGWPKRFIEWREGDTLFISVPFTWELPAVYQRIIQKTFDQPKRILVGGPAIRLMPNYLDGSGAEVGGEIPGVLQRFHPQATRTTVGCPRSCKFCSVPRVEGEFAELEDWFDGWVVCDNNILRASQSHFDRVCDRLEKWKTADFCQGIDCRLLNEYHAERFRRIGKVWCRLALDHRGIKPAWDAAFDKLRRAGIPKHDIQSYVLIGFDSGPDDAWDRCRWVEGHGVHACPMWFHELDSLHKNQLTENQMRLGWTDAERRRIMQWFYHHKQAVVS